MLKKCLAIVLWSEYTLTLLLKARINIVLTIKIVIKDKYLITSSLMGFSLTVYAVGCLNILVT